MSSKDLSLIYVWDAYCGWCYGFSKSLRIFHKNHPELPLTVLSGGLFLGAKKLPISSFPSLQEGWKRISQLTGAVFGEPYLRLLEEGSFVMDSEAAAKGFAALRHFAPERAYDLAAAMQHAFYFEGKSLSSPETYREIAIAHNLDPEKVLARFGDEVTTGEAYEDFARVKQLGVDSYPTLLLQKDGEIIRLAGGAMTAEKIEDRLKNILAAEQRAE